MRYAHIVGWGSYIPRRVMTNDELARIVDTTDEWVYTRTGIRERHIASERETTATLAFEAAARAIAVAGIPPHQVEMIIVATSTPEYIFPSTACRVQDYLGATRAGAFDLSAACSGFVYGLSMAANAIACGAVENAVVIGAETMSRVLDWQDRATCILFGDGAGAVALKGSSIPGGILASSLRSDGSGGNLLSLPAVYHTPLPILGPEYLANGQADKRIQMNGRQIFRFATQVVSEVIEETLERAGLTLAEVDLIVPHQANSRIIEAAAKKLKIEPERFYTNLDKYGNTSAASIPIALVEAVRDGRLQANHNVVFVGFGGGLTWAASVVKWDVTAPPEMTFMDKEWKRARYILARGRSKLRRWGRVIGDKLAGSPTPDARLKHATKKKD